MKTILLCTLALFLTAGSCKKNAENRLPPETQEGKNTFGCLVDGKALTPQKTLGWGSGPLTGNLFYINQRKSWQFYLSVLNQAINSPNRILSIEMENKDFFIANKEYKINTEAAYGRYVISGQKRFFSVGLEGTFTFTRIDTIAKVASGKFSFVAENTDKERVNISEGRFDVKL